MSNFNTVDEAREYRAELEAIKALQAEIIGQQEQLEELAETSGQLATNLEATNKAWNESPTLEDVHELGEAAGAMSANIESANKAWEESPSSEEFEKFKAEWAASRN